MADRDWKRRAEQLRAEKKRLEDWAARVYSLPPAERPYGQRGKYPKPPYYPKNADGTTPCRWCSTPVAPGKRSRIWCSQDCVAEFMRRGHWPTMARYITKRDQVCRMCGGGRYDITAPQLHYSGGQLFDGKPWVFWQISAREGGPDHRPQACPLKISWSVDHIVAVKDGGTDDPQNLRLLCGRCHGEVTAAQHKRWALERRASIVSPQVSLPL